MTKTICETVGEKLFTLTFHTLSTSRKQEAVNCTISTDDMETLSKNEGWGMGIVGLLTSYKQIQTQSFQLRVASVCMLCAHTNGRL